MPLDGGRTVIAMAMIAPGPDGFGWVPVILTAKLVLGSIREEPYRLVAGRQ